MGRFEKFLSCRVTPRVFETIQQLSADDTWRPPTYEGAGRMSEVVRTLVTEALVHRGYDVAPQRREHDET